VKRLLGLDVACSLKSTVMNAEPPPPLAPQKLNLNLEMISLDICGLAVLFDRQTFLPASSTARIVRLIFSFFLFFFFLCIFLLFSLHFSSCVRLLVYWDCIRDFMRMKDALYRLTTIDTATKVNFTLVCLK
jgi:hypothetical protein